MGGLFGGASASPNGVSDAAYLTNQEAQRQKDMLDSQNENQKNFADQLYNQASGNAPSLADAQMRAGQDRSLQQQIAMAKANRSPNAGLQSRNLQTSAADQAQATNQAAAMAKLAEQKQNQGMYGSYMSGQQANLNSLLGANNTAATQNFAAHQAGAAAQNGMNGGMLGTAGQLLGSQYGQKGLDGVGKWFSNLGGSVGGGLSDFGTQVGGMMGGAGEAVGGMGEAGGAVDTLAPAAEVMVAAHGGKVPGKAPVKGDNKANDIVKALLSPGEVVVPRTVVAKGPEAAASFVKKAQPVKFLDHVQASAPAKSDQSFAAAVSKHPGGGFGVILEAHANLHKRLSELENRKKKV